LKKPFPAIKKPPAFPKRAGDETARENVQLSYKKMPLTFDKWSKHHSKKLIQNQLTAQFTCIGHVKSNG
jgi:hypothetical protein